MFAPGLPLAPRPGSHRGEETAMVRTVAFYGLALAAVAVLVQWIEYRHFVRLLPTEIALASVASVFVVLGVWLGTRLTPRAAAEPFARNDKAIASLGLTPRECEVLERLARGEANKEIARAMGLSPNTVKTHVANIYAKLGVSGRGKAVDAARALSLVR
jgi:DNA-binding CsgD family transcriptional regulator